MEPTAILLILTPIFFPIAIKLGIDPIHLGIITYFPKISTALPDYLMGPQTPVVLKQR